MSCCSSATGLFVLASFLGTAQCGLPEIEFLQPLPVVELPAGERFAAVTVLFRNVGGRQLRIRNVRSDCWCATAVVQQGEVLPDSLGALRVQVSAAGLGQDSVVWLAFSVESTACNSPTPLRIAVRRR
ncbi:MAG: DUF1573 domain-containing protein [Candidatus Kapabacteria bacterium]|nr:DUF1573 domain-containing protein [Candidatus Kapabacteria bacterium]MCS7170273.1 DUF1573 domain-containing protein [Candidatus Kapabacteria bacterium]MDW7996626.1 DUF1573 domain-containing protein [Bacteroidota bacterium]MDW8225609.1 DUF1573 domain-containing protein [Bacteroidota bacterium]